MVLLNYNFTVRCMFTRGDTRNPQFIPVTCFCGPYFVVKWNIHGSCKISHAYKSKVTCCKMSHLLKIPYLVFHNLSRGNFYFHDKYWHFTREISHVATCVHACKNEVIIEWYCMLISI